MTIAVNNTNAKSNKLQTIHRLKRFIRPPSIAHPSTSLNRQCFKGIRNDCYFSRVTTIHEFASNLLVGVVGTSRDHRELIDHSLKNRTQVVVPDHPSVVLSQCFLRCGGGLLEGQWRFWCYPPT